MTHGAAHMPFFQYLNTIGLFLIGVILSFFLGRILHELTHVFVANMLGHKVEQIKLNPLKGEVIYTVDENTPQWHVRLISLGPFIVGIVAASMFAVLYWNNWPISIALYVIAVGWFSYTWMGAASDWSITIAKGDGHLWHPDRGEQLLVVALGLIIASFVGSSIELLGDYRISAALGLGFAGLAVMLIGVKDIESNKT